MLTFKEFNRYFDVIIFFREEASKRQDLIQKLYTSSYVVEEHGERLFDFYVEVLSKLMEDDEEWISYFVWETDMGKNNMGVEINGKKIKLKSVADLYKILGKKC
jgi:hypothetical protein